MSRPTHEQIADEVAWSRQVNTKRAGVVVALADDLAEALALLERWSDARESGAVPLLATDTDEFLARTR